MHIIANVNRRVRARCLVKRPFDTKVADICEQFRMVESEAIHELYATVRNHNRNYEQKICEVAFKKPQTFATIREKIERVQFFLRIYNNCSPFGFSQSELRNYPQLYAKRFFICITS